MNGEILDAIKTINTSQHAEAAPELELKQKYWIEYLGDATSLQWSDHKPQDGDDAPALVRTHFSLGQGLVSAVRRASRELDATAAVILHTAWSTVLSRLSGRCDFLTCVSASAAELGVLAPPAGEPLGPLVVHVQFDESEPAATVLERSKHSVAAASCYQDDPVAVMGAAGGSHAQLPRTVFEFRAVDERDPASRSGREQMCGLAPQISLLLQQTSDDIEATLECVSNLFAQATIEKWAAYFRNAVREFASAQGRSVGEVQLMDSRERRRLLETFNATDTAYRLDRRIHRLFEEQVQRTPDAVALLYQEQLLTYAELNLRSNQLARYLSSNGIVAGDLIGICVERSFEMVIGLIGILKAGAAYVPLDPSYPTERLQQMLDDAAPRLVLTSEKLMPRLPASHAKAIALDIELPWRASVAAENRPRQQSESKGALLYVIFTSGSTGRPKGTQMPHAAMVNLIEWHRDTLATSAAAKVLQFAALSFDVAFQEVFSTLCTGGTLVLLDEWVRRDVKALLALVRRYEINRLFLPPLMLQSFSEHFVSAGIDPVTLPLRDVITAGEQLRVTPQIVEFFARLRGCRLHNHYGPTETHVVTSLTLDGDAHGWPRLPSIGRPIANAKIYILDAHGQPVPLGAVGEIYIGGANVALGYMNRPELTAERFLHNPFVSEPVARVYRTGDLGRWREDGHIEYLGRNDDQVKVRGFRIELSEIEFQLTQHPAVKQAVVVAREEERGGKRLIAYLTLRGHADAKQLRSHLLTTLPDHMVPSAFVILQSMPTTASGKLDRRSLPAPRMEHYASLPYEAPRGDVEETLAEVWHELLGVARPGRHDNFFELGGHSLLALAMVERLRRFAPGIEAREVYASSTLANLADALKRHVDTPCEIPPNMIPEGCTAITPQMLPLLQLQPEHIERIAQLVPGGAANIQDIYPLAPLQEGILFHHMLSAAEGDTYVLPTVLSVSSRERVSDLVAALQAVVDRHDVLRTAVLWTELPHPVQVVYRRAELPVETIELRDDQDSDKQMEEWLAPERQWIDLQRAPLMRVRVVEDSRNARWLVLLQLHHIAVDHLTFDILTAETVALLEGHCAWLPATSSYREHVAKALFYARTQDPAAFFRGKLGDVTEPTTPFGLVDVHKGSSRVQTATSDIDPELARAARVQARHMGVSAATLFHAAWALVVAHASGQDDVVFGTLLLGRLNSSADAERTLGMFINTLPLRLKLQTVSPEELVRQTHRELGELLRHEQASLALAQRCSGIAGAAPLFSALLNYVHGMPNPLAEWSRARGIQGHAFQEFTNYPITMLVHDMGEGFALTAQSDRSIDPNLLIEYLRTALQELVRGLQQSVASPALTLQILPLPQRQRLIEQVWPETAVPQPWLIHERFEAQVARAPDAPALVFEQTSITYGELNRKANQLAHYLRGKGIGTGAPVGVCFARSIEMIIGVLAILKAGGAYVPLDPDYPEERLRHMLEDSNPTLVLTQSSVRSALPSSWAGVVSLDEAAEQIAAQMQDNLPAAVGSARPDNLAYIIYTSGSTGKPKGVMVEHRNVVRLFTTTERWFAFSERDVWTLFHSIAFDFSVWELWGALFYGGRVVIVPRLTARSPEDFYRLLCEQRVTVLNQTPSAFTQLIDAQTREVQQQHALRAVIFGGEALELHALKPWVERNDMARTQLINMYGITETTVHVTYRLLTRCDIEQESASVIGVPLPDLRVYLLNRYGNLAPIGVPAEMYVGGRGVARGYLNRPDLASQRFLPDPFSSTPGACMYKSGDLARWRSDGTLEYLGRNDEQVKIRGFRIELGEIQAQLLRHPQVKDVAVIAPKDASGEQRLVAYVVPQDPAEARLLNAGQALRLHLGSTLPEYMVPGAFVLIAKMPLTANGKLDRRALPEPAGDAYASREYEPPQDAVEQAIAEIWQELLQVERIGRADNFFELGGHSLLVMQVASRLRAALTIEVPVKMIFEQRTLASLALRLSELRRARLLDTVAAGGEQIDELFESLASMPESEVQALLQELTLEDKS